MSSSCITADQVALNHQITNFEPPVDTAMYLHVAMGMGLLEVRIFIAYDIMEEKKNYFYPLFFLLNEK
jgi:hypothetical protein